MTMWFFKLIKRLRVDKSKKIISLVIGQFLKIAHKAKPTPKAGYYDNKKIA